MPPSPFAPFRNTSADTAHITGQFTSSTSFSASSWLTPYTNLPMPAQIGLGAALGLGVLGGSLFALKGVSRHLVKSDVVQTFERVIGSKLQAYLTQEPKNLAWWDQPRWQNKSIAQHLVQAVYKPLVSESSQYMHQREFAKISTLAAQAKRIDHEKFTGREFLTYLRVEAELTHSQVGGLYQSAQFLKAAIAAKRHFDRIWQIEVQYYGSKQQEFYDFTDDLLKNSVFLDDFRQQLSEKLEATLPDVVNEQGRTVLKTYAKAILDLSQYEYGLELLKQFKRYELSDFVVLRDIDNLVTKFVKFKQMDLTSSSVVLPDIIHNFASVERLAPIICMPQPLINPEGFANLIHFMALEIKHQVAYRQFKQLVAVLEKWQPVYEQLIEIRRSCSPHRYRLPKEFSLQVPGEYIFEKYKSVLELTS
jgi:hypothetical protein